MWLTLLPSFVYAQTSPIERTQKMLNEIVERSFPELDAKKIRIKTFESHSTYFKTQFSISRFLTFRELRTTIFVNPLVFESNAHEEGIRAILAHELGHALYFKEKNRFELLGLVSLVNGGFTAKFERRTDLIAIERGYGDGLIKYREWLYENVPPNNMAEKRRNYFTPEEIRLLMQATEKNPKLFEKLKKKVPRNLNEVEKALR